MATTQDHELVDQATAKRDAAAGYQPTPAELKAIDQVLIEQAAKRLAFEQKCKGLPEANRMQIEHGVVVESNGDRAIYKSGRDLFKGRAPATKEQDTGKGQGRGG
jgi:hypothetical protein